MFKKNATREIFLTKKSVTASTVVNRCLLNIFIYLFIYSFLFTRKQKKSNQVEKKISHRR